MVPARSPRRERGTGVRKPKMRRAAGSAHTQTGNNLPAGQPASDGLVTGSARASPLRSRQARLLLLPADKTSAAPKLPHQTSSWLRFIWEAILYVHWEINAALCG
ncbi:hypothetical protein NDU88_002600 [Pleurodeles waltl]|uniref:Uncharacterized protein n=1 Tax=Pleurodeles waltl TaxID=8319 RepID=A0AAV7SFK9_PLEWA|nr:hypothetical protein NDU88_002600 [Pleurodeles waltl]